MKLYPKCLEEDVEFGNTSQGYILPCCWWDQPDIFDSGSPIADLLKDKFRLDRAESIKDIVESEEWTTFYDNLKKGKAPRHCYNICNRPGKRYGLIEKNSK